MEAYLGTHRPGDALATSEPSPEPTRRPGIPAALSPAANAVSVATSVRALVTVANPSPVTTSMPTSVAVANAASNSPSESAPTATSNPIPSAVANPTTERGGWLRIGTVFAGTAIDARGMAHPLALEQLVDVGPSSCRLAAVLHNDGGWTETRAFDGEYTTDAARERYQVVPRSEAEQRSSASAGPGLDGYGACTITLGVAADGRALTTSSPWRMRLERLDSAAAQALQTQLEHPVQGALAATKPGRVYRGTPSRARTGAMEAVLPRFLSQDASGTLITAEIAPTAHDGWLRPSRGRIIANAYRAGPRPIPLRSPDRERVNTAPDESVLGCLTNEDSLTLALRPADDGDSKASALSFVIALNRSRRRRPRCRGIKPLPRPNPQQRQAPPTPSP